MEPLNPRLFVRLDEDPLQGPESGAPRGTLQAMAVCPELRPYMSHILMYRESFAPGQEVVEHVVPDGAVRLVVNLGEPPAGGQALQVLGPSAAPALVRLGGRMEGVSITLQPGAAPALLGVPAGELAGTAVALDALWSGGRAADLLGALAGQPDDARRADVLQALLRQGLPQEAPPGHQPAVHAQRLLAASAGRLKVRDAAAAVGLGERRLQQLFHAHIGLSPRAWGRLARLHGCLRALRRQPHAAWADVAAAGGFYDQPHLVHEFRELCGCTPAEFRRMAISGSSKTGR
jgi:AraC-like DNA-binding protein